VRRKGLNILQWSWRGKRKQNATSEETQRESEQTACAEPKPAKALDGFEVRSEPNVKSKRSCWKTSDEGLELEETVPEIFSTIQSKYQTELSLNENIRFNWNSDKYPE